jgi:CheY-like chemotaxis protein
MGGDIQVTSQVGGGTTFRFEIQAQVVSEHDVVKAHAKASQRVIALELDQPHYRILIVDDKPNNRLLLLKLLQPLGFDLREAENGQEAVEIWQSWQPHLIWMDMQMPVMNGYEATRQIKSLANPAQMPKIIALTASTMEEERAVVLGAGCDDFLRKPFREAEIFEAMTHHIGVKFVYETAAPIVHERLTADMLKILPLELRQQLAEAIEMADVDIALRLIETIEPQHRHLAEGLRALVNQFDYDAILALIKAN